MSVSTWDRAGAEVHLSFPHQVFLQCPAPPLEKVKLEGGLLALDLVSTAFGSREFVIARNC